MKRKLLSCMLSLVMVLSLLPTMMLAVEATDDSYTFEQFKNKIIEAAETEDKTFTLDKNVSGAGAVGVGVEVTIDLNGHSITSTFDNADGAGMYPSLLVTTGGKLTLQDSKNKGSVSVKLTGGSNAQSQAAAVMVQNGGEFTLTSGTITATANSGRDAFGVIVFGKSDATNSAASRFTMKGGTVKAEYGVRVLYEDAWFKMEDGTVEGDIAVSGHGDAKGDTSIDISGGTITGKYQGIYQPQTGTLNISAGTITGWGGVEVKGGTVTISGGSITATGEKGQYEDYNMGTSSVGYAVAVVEDNDYKGGTVTIDGGTFKGGVAILNSAKEEVYNSAEVMIKSGVFNSETLYDNLTGDVCKTATTTSGEYTVAQSHKYDPNKTELTKEPTCTDTGVEKVFCTVCGKEGKEYTREVSALGHDYSIWKSDDTQHWQKCARTDCDATTAKENHLSGSTCATCGHNCKHLNVTNYEAVPATCAVEGYEAYIVCSDCGHHVTYNNDDKAYVITSDTLVRTAKLAHSYSYKYDSSKHWQVCSECGDETAKLDHEYSGRTCTVCGYVKPSSGGSSSSSSSTTYAVSVNTAKNGSVTVSPKNASKGTTVTVTTTPDKGWTLETLTVLDKDGKEVELTIVKVGETYTFKMPSGNVTVAATFMEDNTMLNYFADVSAADYFYDAVLWAAENGITTGVDDLHFAPNNNCTRAQIVTFLWRAAGSPAPKSVSSFSDVASDSYYAEAVAWAIENGVTNGTGEGVFSPDEICTRAQSVTFLARALSGKAAASTAFSDVPAGSWYAEAVAWAAENGVTTGIGGGLFGSDNNCTRGQIVTFLFRAYNK